MEKFGVFWNFMDHTEILEDNEQHIILNLRDQNTDKGTFISVIYAKCTTIERKNLWESIQDMNNVIDGPWCVGGNFNVIMDSSKKIGGKPHRAYKSLDFISTMDQIKGSKKGSIEFLSKINKLSCSTTIL